MRRALAVVSGTMLLAILALGQANDGDLGGSVFDQSGAVVSGATVEVTNTATNVKTTVVTDSSGNYRFRNLLVGNYDLTATGAGFGVSTLRNISVSLNKAVTSNVALEVGATTQTIEVTATAIDTTTAQISTAFQTREAIDTPASSLPMGPMNLALLGAGVASSGGIGQGEGPSVGGQRPRNNSFYVEGVDNNRTDVTGRNILVPNEAVAEFSMMQNQFSPEFGNGTGGQFHTVIRGGGNQIHGALYEYFQNRHLNAMDQAAVRNGLTSNPRFDSNTLGGSIGGPIVKNKLFYYGLYQYNPFGASPTPLSSVLAPTAAGYATLGTLPGISATNLGVLKQYLPEAPAATSSTVVAGVSIPIGILPLLQPTYSNGHTYLLSMDYDISDRDRLRGRFQEQRTSGQDSTALGQLPAFFLGRPHVSKFLSFSWFRTISPSLLNELRLGYNRFNDTIPAGNFQYPGLDAFPNITIRQDLNVQLGPAQNSPQATILNTYQITDNLSWNKGRHNFKFGFDGRNYINLTNSVQRQRGDYGYNTLNRFLLDQNPNAIAERSTGSLPYSGNRPSVALYGNDEFRVRQNLTLNVGLRWEWKAVPRDDAQQALNSISDLPGLITFRKPTAQMTAFGPRIGLAYSPGAGGLTSIRAGFGISYDKNFDNLSYNTRPAQVMTTARVPANPITTGFLAGGGIRPTAPSAAACSTVQSCRNRTASYLYDQQLPYAMTWNLGVQRVIHNDYTAEIRYVGTRGVHLFTQSQLNVGSPVTSSLFLPTFLQAPSAATLAGLNLTAGDLYNINPTVPAFLPFSDLYGGGSIITAYSNRGNSIYHGLAAELTRRFARNLLFRGAYTWSHNIDDSSADVFTTLLSPRRPEDSQNLRPERSSSFLDRRHRLTYSWVYDLPWFRRSDNAVLRHALGGYVLSGTYTYESPQFSTVQSGIDSNLNFDAASDRAIVNLNGVPNTGTTVYAIDQSGAIVGSGVDDSLGDPSTVAFVAINPNAQYIQAGYGARTNSGRQTMAARPINNWDLQVKKEFIFTERYKFQVAVQMFNLFNHAQYVPGYTNTVQFQLTNSTNNHLIPGNSLFNRPDLVYSSNPRALQLTARFQF